jgi:hypothetical protein
LARVERWFSLLVLAVVAVFFIVSFQYNILSPISGVGGAFLPRIVSLILLFLVGFYVWGVFRNKSTTDSNKDAPTKEQVMRQILLAIALLACLFFVEILGMLITLGLFLLFGLHYLEKISWVKSIVFSIVTMVCFFLLFVQWLNVRLPSGLFL